MIGVDRRLWMVRWLFGVLLGLALLIAAALLRGTPEDVGWYVAHVLPSVAVVVVSASHIGQRVLPTAVAVYALVLVSLTWLVGVGAPSPFDEGLRVNLFTDNPNLLAADIVTVTLAAALLRPHGLWALGLPAAFGAVLFTGSRTALLALGVAIPLWWLLNRMSVRVRIAGLVSLTVLASFIAVATWEAQTEAASTNLVEQTISFARAPWRVVGDAVVVVQPGVVEGPLPGTSADRVSARSGSRDLVMMHGVGLSEEGEPYVASVYLRADSPQELALNTQFSRTTCTVGLEWARCATPVGYGNGRHHVQFRLKTVAPSGEFDVFAFGPQLEKASTAGAYIERGNTLLPVSVIRRFAVEPTTEFARMRVTYEYLIAFASSPFLGEGQAFSPLDINGPGAVSSPTADQPSASHAHNLLVGRLVADGLVGLAGWVLIFLPLMVVAILGARSAAAPWLAGLLILNMFDMTLFHSGSYFSTAVVVGIYASSQAAATRNPSGPTAASSVTPSATKFDACQRGQSLNASLHVLKCVTAVPQRLRCVRARRKPRG